MYIFSILEFVLPKLKQFRELTTTYPATFEYMSMEIWLETLDNMIEQIETRMVKVNRRLKKQFGDQAEFSKKVKDVIKTDANGNVSVD